MRRTHDRPLPAGDIDPTGALVFGLVLEVVAFALLWATVEPARRPSLAVSATLFYVFVYTIWLKPRSPQNIVIGGAAGAVPVLVGWAAVTGSLAAPRLGDVRHHLLLDAAALLGPVAPLPRRLRRGRASRCCRSCEGIPRRGPPDRRRTRSSSSAVTLAPRPRHAARLDLPQRRRRARRDVHRARRSACRATPRPQRAIKLFTFSNTTSRCCSRPLPSTSSSAAA